MNNKMIRLFAVFAVLFPVFALSGCPLAHDDLLTLDEVFKTDRNIIQAEDGEIHGSVKNGGTKGPGTVGKCMDELNPEGDGSTNYFILTLPDGISGGKYTVKFRYASGGDGFGIKFTVNEEAEQTTGVVANNGWDLGDAHNFAGSQAPVELKAGDKLKIWTLAWGCIDYIKLEPAN
jgi:hypothetical protein